jgi:alcohol dehydrogenase YqhD (iron-dependent ADH family)
VLLHYGGGSAERSGLIGRIEQSLTEAGLAVVKLGGVLPNPRLSLALTGIELARSEKIDFVLAAGGGSAIDSAKAIAMGAPNDDDVWQYFLKKKSPAKVLPIAAVPTVAAAGSEMSDSAVITNEDGMLKRGAGSDLIRPKLAFMNPELTMTLPAYHSAAGVVDILMHTMDRYFTYGTMDITDQIAEALMRNVLKFGKKVMKNPQDYEARAELMWAGSLSHNGLTGIGSTKDWSNHAMEHELSGMFDVSHGAGLAAIWGSWARYVYEECPERFARFGKNVLGVDGALEAIEAMEKFYKSINMPTSIGDMGINATDAQIAELADKCSFGGTRTIGLFKSLAREDMENIYRMAR